jgi:class 3 adenylate cyclase
MEHPDTLEEGRHWGRMDFVMEKRSFDLTTNTFQVALTPDPRRYTRVEDGENSGYLDKYLRMLIPDGVMMKECAEQMRGLPIYSLSPSIKSAPEYATSRNEALRSELQTGSYVKPTEPAIPHQPLEAGAATKWLAFLSVDICGGTALRLANRTGFDAAYKIFLREMGTVVGQFHGTILKTTGDGFIAYIDHPAFTQQCDNTVDLGLTLLVLVRDSINPALVSADLPQLKIRVGADYGTVQFTTHEVPSTGFTSSEIGSDALNRSVKIEQTCGENEFRIGRSLYELVHVQWLERATEVPFDGESVGIAGYKSYRVT